jgi:hypothetical protein
MSTDNFIWTDELVEEYRKFCIENNSVALMLGAVGIIELFKLKIKNGGNVTPEDIISAAYKGYEQSEQTHKDYEIQCIVKNGKNYWLQKDGLYNSDLFGLHHDCEWILDKGGQIYSVKRLIDGEVFSVGDRLDGMDEDCDIIESFWTNHAGNDLWISTNDRNQYGCAFDSAKKAKEVLVTSKDGITVEEYLYITQPDWEEGYKRLKEILKQKTL